MHGVRPTLHDGRRGRALDQEGLGECEWREGHAGPGHAVDWFGHVGCFADGSAVGSLAVAGLADKRSRHCADRQQLIDNWGSKKKNSKVPIHARQRLGGTSLSEEECSTVFEMGCRMLDRV